MLLDSPNPNYYIILMLSHHLHFIVIRVSLTARIESESVLYGRHRH
jgi:hypothetical protein